MSSSILPGDENSTGRDFEEEANTGGIGQSPFTTPPRFALYESFVTAGCRPLDTYTVSVIVQLYYSILTHAIPVQSKRKHSA